MRVIDLSHTITDGMVTYPGLPVPKIRTHLSREDSRAHYEPGTSFHIGVVTLCTNTGTYLDVPFHRYPDGDDLADLPLDRVVEVPAVMLDVRGPRTIELTDVHLPAAGFDALAGHAVLLRTDHSDHWGTDTYAADHPHLSVEVARALVEADVAVVGIDSLNIDGTRTGARPVHSVLLAAGIPIVEHLTELRELPPEGFTFTAAPPRLVGAGTFTVRAYARCP